MADDIEQEELADEKSEERKAADGKARKLNAEISDLPTLRRNQAGQVTTAVFKAKAPFKGDVTLRLHHEVASAYWSLTPGMKITAMVVETGDKEYEVERLDIVSH